MLGREEAHVWYISPDFLPLGLLLLQPLELFLLLGSLFPPFVDVLLELLVQLALLGFLAGLEEVSISPLKHNRCIFHCRPITSPLKMPLGEK